MTKTTRVVLGLAATAILAGCGSNIETNAGGGGQGSTTTTTTSPAGDPASCNAHMSLNISWDGADASTSYACAGNPQDATFELDAAVDHVEGGAIALDTCPPNADCAGSLRTLHVDAMSLAPAIPVGTFVHVKFFIHSYIDCPVTVRVTNLPSWAGVTNPTTTAPLIWIDASIDGQGTTTMSGPEYGLAPQPVTCGPGMVGDAVYDYCFYDPQDPSNAVTVPVGQVGTLHVQRDGQPQVWTFGNARAGCYGGPNGTCPGEGYPFDFWVTQAPGG